MKTRYLLLVASVAATACGGSTPATTPVAPTVSPPASVAPTPAAKASAAASAPVAAKPDDDDPTESGEVIEMTPQFPKNTPKAKFPKATIGDRACWSEIGLTGDHDKDYAEVIAKCGAPTGMLEYAKPQHGRLHNVEGGDKNDKRDSFKLKVWGGYCYRYMAIADGTMKDMDILVMSKTGALVADDRTHSPVAIIHNDKPWCVDDDTEYTFNLDVNALGHGHYIFTVWARPK